MAVPAPGPVEDCQGGVAADGQSVVVHREIAALYAQDYPGHIANHDIVVVVLLAPVVAEAVVAIRFPMFCPVC